jgi:hypothetical protein
MQAPFDDQLIQAYENIRTMIASTEIVWRSGSRIGVEFTD